MSLERSISENNSFLTLLNQIETLPEINLSAYDEEENIKVKEIIDGLSAYLKYSDLYQNSEKEFQQKVKKLLNNLDPNRAEQIYTQFLDYFKLLRNSNFFNFFQAIYAAISHVWDQVNVFNKQGGDEKYLGGDELPLLLCKLLPDNIEQIKQLNTRLNMLEKLVNYESEDSYAIIVLITACKEKINQLISPLSAHQNENEKLIKPVVAIINQPEFTNTIDAFATLRPIKSTCKNYNDELQETMYSELSANQSLCKRFKIREGTIGATSLLHVPALVDAYNDKDPQLMRFAENHTKFRVSLQKYLGLTKANIKLQNTDPFTAINNFHVEFDQQANLFNEPEDGPGKRFFNKIRSLFSQYFCACRAPGKPMPENNGQSFVQQINSFFSQPNMPKKHESTVRTTTASFNFRH